MMMMMMMMTFTIAMTQIPDFSDLYEKVISLGLKVEPQIKKKTENYGKTTLKSSNFKMN